MVSPLESQADSSLQKTEGLINGAWVAAQNGQARFAVTDPATGLELAQVANLGADNANPIEIGHVLCSSDVVRHLSFTGSTAVGRILMRGRHAGDRRNPSHGSWRALLRANGTFRRDQRDDVRQRGNLRPGGAGVQF
jgi:hypothetical protein